LRDVISQQRQRGGFIGIIVDVIDIFHVRYF
jgi:hypothetical protein